MVSPQNGVTWVRPPPPQATPLPASAGTSVKGKWEFRGLINSDKWLQILAIYFSLGFLMARQTCEIPFNWIFFENLPK